MKWIQSITICLYFGTVLQLNGIEVTTWQWWVLSLILSILNVWGNDDS